MEFPSDVLSVIRDFSRPRMQFVHEWASAQRAIQENQLLYCPVLHERVKAKLFTPDAKRVIDLYVAFIGASEATRNLSHEIHTAEEFAIAFLTREELEESLINEVYGPATLL